MGLLPTVIEAGAVFNNGIGCLLDDMDMWLLAIDIQIAYGYFFKGFLLTT